jgi:hypothetical protein
MTPIGVSVSGSGNLEASSLHIKIDGVDQTSLFNFTGGPTASTSINFTSGKHTVDATANVWNTHNNVYDQHTAHAEFEAGPPGSLALAIQPTAVILVPGGSTSVTATITRSGAFAGDVTVAESDPGYATTNVITVPASAGVGTLTVQARADAKVTDNTHAIIASGTLYSDFLRDQKALGFRVGHKTGPFQPGSIVARNALDTAMGPDGQTTVVVQNGAPMKPRFEAKFWRPTWTPGSLVDFDPGTPIVGGAGFCPSGSVGVGYVVSGGSTTVNHTVTFVMIEDVYTQIPLPIAATGQGATVVTPAIYFSSDCSVVIMVGADKSAQHAFSAEVYDLDRRRSLCTMAFDASTPPLQAIMLTPAGNNQLLQLSAGGVTTGCPMF